MFLKHNQVVNLLIARNKEQPSWRKCHSTALQNLLFPSKEMRDLIGSRYTRQSMRRSSSQSNVFVIASRLSECWVVFFWKLRKEQKISVVGFQLLCISYWVVTQRLCVTQRILKRDISLVISILGNGELESEKCADPIISQNLHFNKWTHSTINFCHCCKNKCSFLLSCTLKFNETLLTTGGFVKNTLISTWKVLQLGSSR